MKKVIVRTFLIVVCLLLLAIVLTDIFLGQIVKSGFNKYAPAMVGTDTHVAGATLSPLSGAGSLDHLSVANAKGWTDKTALTAGKIRIEMETSSIFSERIVINELVIDQVEFNYETHLLKSNIGDLLSNANNASKESNAAAEPQKNGHAKTFVIQHLKITNAKVKVGVGVTAVTLPVSDIELNNLGSGQGVNAGELTVIILRTILEGAAKASISGAGHLGSAATGAVGAAAEGVLNSLNKALGNGH